MDSSDAEQGMQNAQHEHASCTRECRNNKLPQTVQWTGRNCSSSTPRARVLQQKQSGKEPRQPSSSTNCSACDLTRPSSCHTSGRVDSSKHSPLMPTTACNRAASAGPQRPHYQHNFQDTYNSARPLSRQQPRAKHPTDFIDPHYMSTESYVQRPGIGKVYDWWTQHERNNLLLKQKKEEKRTTSLAQAAQKELVAREDGQKAWKQWVLLKEAEKQLEMYHTRWAVRTLARAPQELNNPKPRAVLDAREREWRNTLHKGDVILRAKVIKRPGYIANVPGWDMSI